MILYKYTSRTINIIIVIYYNWIFVCNPVRLQYRKVGGKIYVENASHTDSYGNNSDASAISYR